MNDKEIVINDLTEELVSMKNKCMKDLEARLNSLEKMVKEKDKYIRQLENKFEKKTNSFSETIKESEEIEETCTNEDYNDKSLDRTFLNPASEMLCDVCDFVAKNFKGLQIHKQAKHTKTRKYTCDLCDCETNNKNFFNTHKASKCSKIIVCELGCGKTFETEREETEHMTAKHPKAKTFPCDLCDFKTSNKKFSMTTQKANVPGYSYVTLVVGKVLII